MTTLAPGASTTCTGTHTITQAEVDAGTVDNSATATGTPPGGGTTSRRRTRRPRRLPRTPALTIDKTAGVPSGTTAGSTIDYTFLVTNTGNVTITGIVINDAQLDAAAVCPVTTLVPGESTTCTGTHTITQAEVDAGHGRQQRHRHRHPAGRRHRRTSPPDTTSTPIAATPALTIDKTAGVPSGTTAGSTIDYTFLVTNTGNVTITGIVIDDAQLDAAAVCPVTTLVPGDSTTCTGTHTITQAEVDAGTVDNTATATGTPPGGGTDHVGRRTRRPRRSRRTPALTIDKTAGVPSGTTAGSTIDYTLPGHQHRQRDDHRHCRDRRRQSRRRGRVPGDHAGARAPTPPAPARTPSPRPKSTPARSTTAPPPPARRRAAAPRRRPPDTTFTPIAATPR